MTNSEKELWNELDRFLAAHRHQYKMSFALEYSEVTDWVGDLTPRRGHPKARQYGEVCQARGVTREIALRKLLHRAHEIFGAGTVPPDEEAAGQSAPTSKASDKDPAAVELGRRGGLKGGKARAAKLSPERRKEIATKAGRSRRRTTTGDEI
jgi:general stress protein YciG